MTKTTDRVLVVDDDEIKRYTIVHALRRAGFDVIEATTGAEVHRSAVSVALVILDVKLPDIDGIEVCRRLKFDPATAHLPILLLSATFVGPDSQVRGLDSGADAYLTNAAELPVLVATVRALIRMKRAEEQARRGEARLRIALEAGRLGEWDLDLHSEELTASARFKAIFSRPADAPFTLADLDTATHPDDRDAARTARLRATDGTAPYDIEYRVVWPSGEVRWVLMRAQVVAGNPHRHLIGVALDVTEPKRAEEALREADRKKDEFLAMLAHELRNPLAPIRNALEIERAPAADAQTVSRARETMARQLGNMVRLIDDLLDVSRITKGKIELRPLRVELAAVLNTAIETSRPLIEGGGHQLTTHLPTAPVWLTADPTRLAQVVANLLNNAAKYTPNGGRIKLSAALVPADLYTSEAPDSPLTSSSLHAALRVPPVEVIEIRVTDNGVGIAPDVLPRVWEMFAQANSTLSRAQGGLGIGLTLVRRLVELHGGSVSAASAGPGQGSEFIIRLPVAQDGAPPEAPPPPSTRQGTARRILVVDDHPDGRESLALLLELSGHQVRTATDGPTALAAAAEFSPDVVLLDIGLPGIDGYEVARRLRAQPAFAGMRLIALTGWGQDADRERSHRVGFDVHLVKPVDPAELRRALE